KEIKTFRVWLVEETNFKSFKTEKGWTGEKNSQGVVIFTSSETVKVNELVKFGLKTDKINSVINWKALDQENNVIDTGVTKLSKLSEVKQNSNIELNENYDNNGISIFSESTFRTIPDKPNAGSTIRIAGEQFSVLQKFDFYIDNKKIGNITSDNNGNFITTMQIPNIEKEGSVDFKITGYDGIEKIIPVEVGKKKNIILEDENIRLGIKEVPQTLEQGEKLEIEGNGQPGSSIILKIINPDEIITNIRIVKADSTGTWKLSNPIIIPFDAIFGEYTLMVSDTNSNVKDIIKKWNVGTNKIIIINPEKIKFDPGELIRFTGTATPNIQLELILEDSFGDEMVSEVLEVSDSGIVEFEYQTTENEDKEGTWTLIATQGNNKEFIYVGYDEVPTIPVNIKFNKSNYKITEKAVISLAGEPSEKISLIIITPSGNVSGKDVLIQLESNGTGKYNLDLTGYISGIYTAVVKSGGSQSTENFAVGTLTGSGEINAKVTNTEYNQGERLLLLGNTVNSNSLMTATLIDPNGTEIKSIEIVSNSEGMFSEERLKIPRNGQTGIWQIEITSGSNRDKIEFSVFSSTVEGMSIKVNEKVEQGSLLEMKITTSKKTSVIIEITDMDGEQVQKLTCITTKEFKCESFWSIPKDTIPGTYTVKALDTTASVETTFEVTKK
ncbi:biofilm-associated protein, partial [Nitrosopumilus sp.]|nr:biofilm-associated protein [Nitrosopumilus sp.]